MNENVARGESSIRDLALLTDNRVEIAMEFVRVLLLAAVYVLASCARQSYSQTRTGKEECSTQHGGAGTCINIRNCTILYEFVNRDLPFGQIKSTINNFICDNGNQRVCCPFKVPDLISSNDVDHSEHPNYKLLPRHCGYSIAAYIILGNKTELFEFPWVVALQQEPGGRWGCGGTLISDRYILTAAHCIKSKTKVVKVRLGEHNFKTNPDCVELGSAKTCANETQDFDVTEDDVVIHPEFDSRTYTNDIALIRLKTRAHFSESVAPICLPITVPEKTIKFERYVVTGWGATESNFYSSILLKVSVPKVDNTVCAPKYADRASITDKQLCAGGKGKDSCPGDSGGPLTAEYTNDEGSRTLQYGIVSLGPTICGLEGFPVLYTKVAKYVGWILDNIRS
ncbi:hypothetical protein Trydic_g15613 [Trypoxylus dichotomus]